MKIKFKLHILFSIVLIASFYLKCDAQIQITVLDKQQNIPLPAAHVLIKPYLFTNTETLITDNKGIATIPEAYYQKKAILKIQYVGYTTSIDTVILNASKTYYLQAENVYLNEVVITAQYAPNNPDKAVQKIKIIDAQKIQSMAAVNLRDVLSNELNIRLSQDNILGSSMSMQGITGENVKILIDGVPVIGRLNGNIDLSQINMNDLERIEIVEGPLSVNYGTNALAGTINIITRKHTDKKHSINLTSFNENVGNFNQHISYFNKVKKNNIIVSAGRNFFDGWNANDETFPRFNRILADSSRYKQWKPKEQWFGRINYGYQFNKHSLHIKSEYFNEKITNRGLPIKPYLETAFDDYYFTQRIDNAIIADGKISSAVRYNSIFSYNQFKRIKNTYTKDLTTLNSEIIELPEAQDTSRFNLYMARGSFIFATDSSKLKLEAGYDLNFENTYGRKITGNQKENGDYALFTTAEYKPIEAITIKPGVRVAYNTSYKAPVTPSLNILYKLKNYSVRASYARGFRAPSLKELFFYFVDINHNIIGNNQLKAEFSDNFSLNLLHKKIIKQSIIQTDVSFFYNDIKNLITLAQINNQQYSYVNIGIFKTQGISLNQSLLIKHLKLNAGASYVGRYNVLHAQYPLTDKFLYYPEIRFNTIYDFKNTGLSIALFYKYQGRFNNFSLNANNEIYNTFIDAYQLLDLTLTKKIFKQKLLLSLGSKNLFNVTNVAANMSDSAHSGTSFSTPVATGRTYFLKIDINL